MRGGGDIFFNKINSFIKQNTPTFKERKDAIIKVLENSKVGYNSSIARSVTPARMDFNKSSRFKNTLKATIDYLNAISDVNTNDLDKVKFPQYPIVNELADVLLDIFKIEPNMKDDEKKNNFILQFIYIKIYILFIEFQYFCNRINDIKNYNIVEPLKEDVGLLAAETAAKEEAEKKLAAETTAKEEAEKKLAAETTAKEEAEKKLAAETEEKEKAKKELAAETAAKKIVEEKYKLLEDNILTIDEEYFKNAYDNAISKFKNGQDFDKILDNITNIWNMLKDDIKSKYKEEITNIINVKIPKLKGNRKLPIWARQDISGGKRKINSLKTKRK
jgi:hypothetical protein